MIADVLRKMLRLPVAVPRRVLRSIRIRKKRARCHAHPSAVLYDDCRINNHRSTEAVSIGAGTHVLSTIQTLDHGGQVDIGEFCYLGERSYIWSAEHIRIGNRVMISHGVNIHDNISHPISAKARHAHFRGMIEGSDLTNLEGVTSAPVTIGDDAWIGFNATILKGVTIGRGAIVGACSLVTDDVPDWGIVVGNPARLIGKSEP